MPTGNDYPIAIVIVDTHEPHGEVATRLLELADEKGYDARTVEAQRGEHDAALSFRVPQDVAEAFNAERDESWPAKIENDDEKAAELDAAGVDGDAYAAEQARSARAAAVENAAADNEPVDNDADPNTPPVRKSRPGKATRE